MKKRISLFITMVALSSLAACNTTKSSSSSLAPSSSDQPSTTSEVSSSSEPSSSESSSAQSTSDVPSSSSSSEAPSSSSSSEAPSSSSEAPSSSSSSEAPSSSSEAPSSSSETPSSSSSSSSSSSEPTPEPETTDIIIPSTEYDSTIEEPAPYSNNLLLNHRYLSLLLDDGDPNTPDGSSMTLRGILQPLQSGQNLTFKSADPTIASVDANGLVKGLKKGKTTIEVSDSNHPDVKQNVPVTVFDSLVPGVDGVHYTQEEIDAAQEGDPAYGKTTEDWKVDPIPNDQETITNILNSLSTISDGVHYTQEEIDAAQEGDPAYGKTTDDYKVLPESMTLNEIVDHELYEKRIYKNGVLHMYSCWDQHLVASEPNAYLRISEKDGDVKTDNGAITFKDYEWIFSTNKYYDTYVFHQTGDVKNYYPVPTNDYMDHENAHRTEPLFDILDNIFTNGHDVFSNTLENCRLSGFLEYAIKNYTNVEKSGYGLNNGSFLFDCKVNYNTETATQDDETRYGIPYGTPTPTIYNLRFTVNDNKLLGYSNHGVMTYDIGDDHYEEVYDIDHLFERITDENRDSLLFLPNIADYTLAETLFDV